VAHGRRRAVRSALADLPREVIVTALREHQRFFAVEDAGGRLLPAFLLVRNGDTRGLDVVRKGGEDVLAARLADARFYWETDLRHPPAEQVEALARVVWMEGLGTLRDKADRLEALSGWIAARLAPESEEAARRAALLCKTDLLSEMIGSGKEYASLEGVIGAYYARRGGEPEAVAAAIGEHYRPRGASDQLPTTEAGPCSRSPTSSITSPVRSWPARCRAGAKIPTASGEQATAWCASSWNRRRHLDLRDASMEMTRTVLRRQRRPPAGRDHEEAR
jgi:hypothetical protein